MSEVAVVAPPKIEAKALPPLKERMSPTTERRMEEVKAVGSIAIERHSNMLIDQARKNDAPPASSNVTDLTVLRKLGTEILTPPKGDFLECVDGIKVKGADGKVHTLKKIMQVQGDTFYCDNGVDMAGIPVPREQIVDAYLAGHKDAIVAELPQAQQKAAALHIELLQMKQQGKSPEEIAKFVASQDADKIDADVIASAKDMGLLTSVQLESFVYKITQANTEGATEDGIKLANTYLEKFDGTNLVSPDAFKEVIKDFAPAQLKVQRDEVQSVISDCKKELANPDLPDNLRGKYKTDLEEATVKLEVMDELYKNAGKEGGTYGEYIDKYMKGEVSAERGRSISAAIESGDIDQILQNVVDIEAEMNAKLSEEERAKAQAEHAARIAHRKEMIKKMGIGGLGIALLILYSAMSSSGQGGH